MKARGKVARALMTFAFLLSTLQFLIVERGDEMLRVIPIVVFCAAAIVGFICAPSSRRQAIAASCFHPQFILIFGIAGVLPTVSSIYSSQRATLYGALMVIVLLSARSLVTATGLDGILQSLYHSLAMAIPLVVALSLPSFLGALGGKRYSPFEFHPNILAMFCAVLAPLHLWIGGQGKLWRMVHWFGALFAAAVLFATGSRGSLISLVVALVCASLLKWMAEGMRITQTRAISALLIAGALVAGSLGALRGSENADKAQNFVTQKLDLNSRDRGVSSGMSGRTKIWDSFVPLMLSTLSAFGNGYRTTSESFNRAIDNGYLTTIYELGVVPTLVILIVYGRNLWYTAWYYLRGDGGDTALRTYFCLVGCALLNGAVTRVLFGYGDPVSIFTLCFVAAVRDDLKELRTIPVAPRAELQEVAV